MTCLHRSALGPTSNRPIFHDLDIIKDSHREEKTQKLNLQSRANEHQLIHIKVLFQRADFGWLSCAVKSNKLSFINNLVV